VRGRRVVAGLVAMLLGVSIVSAAQAQDLLPEKSVSVRNRPKPEYEAPGVDLGAFLLRPTLTLGALYDDNVYATEAQPTDDTIGTAALALDLQSRGAVVPMSLHGGVSSLSYARLSSENAIDWDAGASVGFGSGGRTQVNLSGDFARAHESRMDASFPQSAAEPPPYDTAGALLEVTRSFASGSLRLSADYEDINFKDGITSQGAVLDQDFRDRASRTFEARLQMGIAHSVGAVARIVRQEQDYRAVADPTGVAQGSFTNAFYGGAALDLSNLLRGELTLGVLRLNNRDPAQQDRTALAIGSRIEFYVSQLVTATFDLQRTSGPSDLAGSASYIGTQLNLGIDYELRRSLVLSLGGIASRREYSGIGKAETTKGGRLGAAWLINRRMRADVSYARQRRESPNLGPARNFSRGELAATLQLAL
jgi:hypothetical protein